MAALPPISLSVIIVNYNVRYFLEQTLYAVRRASEGLAVEVFVVDNNSVDTSCDMVREKFPEVVLIANRGNPGFAKANNQAIRISQGRYVLLLNPDTVVQEDTFRSTVAFMDAHPDAGALGIRMIDGSGTYLPESKRGFPTPWVAFCKTAGIGRIFPRSSVLNGYYMGNLPNTENAEVDVLSGAFMLMRRETLDKVGLLDEAFFMYGEDIDLSYRIQKGGYKNYYFAESTIIHYKGESTKKGSLNYVRVFYQAMIIFARKHFTGRQQTLFVQMLYAAIYFRAALTLALNTLRAAALPLCDAVLLGVGMLVLKNFWASSVFHDANYYGTLFLTFNIPLYVVIWLVGVWLSGGYDDTRNLPRLARGLAWSTLVLAAIYGFLDAEYRASRALIVLGAVYAVVAMSTLRLVLHFIKHRNFDLTSSRVKNSIIIGSEAEGQRVAELLRQAIATMSSTVNIIGLVSPTDQTGAAYLGQIDRLEEIARVYKVDEIIFCSRDLSAETMMREMTRLGSGIDYKMVAPDSWGVVGSSSRDTTGELYTIDIRYRIAQPVYRRHKRTLDLALATALLTFTPLLVWFTEGGVRRVGAWVAALWGVLRGKRTLVGYATTTAAADTLPRLAPALLTPADAHTDLRLDAPTLARLNFLYAKDYTIERDIEILWRGWRRIGVSE